MLNILNIDHFRANLIIFLFYKFRVSTTRAFYIHKKPVFSILFSLVKKADLAKKRAKNRKKIKCRKSKLLEISHMRILGIKI